jgi:membrane protease YdiL (CAAX protease family)
MTPPGHDSGGQGEPPEPRASARLAVDTPAAGTPRWQRRRLSALREPLDFLAFIARPSLRRGRGRRHTDGVGADWASGLRPARLLMWWLILWTVNLTVLGPLAVDVANSTGVERARTILPVHWPYVVLWAPLIEEMIFRFWLRRPPGWVLYPALAACGFLLGPSPWLAAAVGAVAGWQLMRGRSGLRSSPSWRRLRHFRRRFPVYLHLSVVAFALMHLGNYRSADAAWWLLPLVVLPQWFTGMVLAWTRVRHGIGAAIVLHAGFNALPLALLRLL